MTTVLNNVLGGTMLAAGVTVTALMLSHQPPVVDVDPAPLPPTKMVPAAGPLRVNPAHGRYFTDPSGRIVYLTGAHTWNSLQDLGKSNPPAPFAYDRYLDFLQSHNLNFIRLWRWDTCQWTDPDTKHRLYASPQPWVRTGPGLAADGLPKFDLREFDERYFTRLRSRVEAARARGIYVSIMLFEGWTVRFTTDAWRGHPFYPANNINGLGPGLDGDRAGVRIHTLQLPAVVKLQEDYVRKIVDTVNDLDNVLFEVANEAHSGSHAWQDHMLRFVRACEANQPKQHPIGLTSTGGTGRDDTARLLASPADWISPNAQRDDYRSDPPAASGAKVIIVDTDHLWGIGGDTPWVWKSFLRGMNPILMDPYEEAVIASPVPKKHWEPVRRSLGYARSFATQINLAAMVPRPDLATSSYCLANPGSEYLVYLPPEGSNRVTVDLSATEGSLAVEWFDPVSGRSEPAASVAGGGSQAFEAPFPAGGVLHLYLKTTARAAANRPRSSRPSVF